MDAPQSSLRYQTRKNGNSCNCNYRSLESVGESINQMMASLEQTCAIDDMAKSRECRRTSRRRPVRASAHAAQLNHYVVSNL